MSKRSLKFFLMLALLLILVLSFSSAGAQLGGEELPEGISGDDVYRVASGIYCDVCAGVPISACPSPTCAAWRQEIATLLGEGYADADIRQYFADRYGDEVTGVPLQNNQRNLALGLPVLLIAVIGVVIGYQIWRLRQRGQSRAQQAAHSAGLLSDHKRPVPDNVDPEYLKRFLSLLEDY